MKRFKYDSATRNVVAVECQDVGHPNRDADGETQFNNTHFDTEEPCWDHALTDCRAGVRLATRRLQEASRALQVAKDDLATETLEWADCMDNHVRWQDANGKTPA